MYLPEPFLEDDPERIRDLMRDNAFATLVTTVEGRPFATHLPLLIEPAPGAGTTLIGHMARANPQWRGFDGMAEALAIFVGPHAYVSPRWYGVQPSVPTWNYAVVHAYGAPRVVEGAEAEAILARMVACYEGEGPGAWTMAGLPRAYLAGMMRGLVAFEMPIARLEAKSKLSQNRSPDDRARVVAALESADRPGDRGVAALMRARAEGKGK